MITSGQRAKLKALAHPKKPVVLVGKKGITEAVIDEVKIALLTHELMKVRFRESEDVKVDADKVAAQSDAELVAVLGNVGTFYKAHPERPKIKI